MKATAYLFQTRNGVYYARFIVPLAMRGSGSTSGREIRISTLTKDPRDAASRSRILRVMYESLLYSGGVFSREKITTHLQNIMATFKAPPPGTPKFNVEYDFASGKAKFTDVKPDEHVTVLTMMEDMQRKLPTPVQHLAIAPVGIDPKLSEHAQKLISEITEEYLDSELEREKLGQIGPKNVDGQRSKLRVFNDYFSGKRIGELTPDDIKTYMNDLAYYPTNRDVAGIAEGLSVREVIKLAKADELFNDEDLERDFLSASTIKQYLITVSHFIHYCDLKLAVMERTANKMPSILRDAPKAVRKVKEPFTDEDLTRLFGSRYFWEHYYNQPHQYWTCVIGLFTGARLNEICQLNTSDISEYEKGKWQFSFNDEGEEDEEGNPVSKKRLKTTSSNRTMPVHPRLVELGFIEYWKKRKKLGKVNLLDVTAAKKDGYGKTPGQFFNDKLMKEYVGINSPKKVFHSFRYTVITRLRQSIIDMSGKAAEENIENYPEGLVLRQMVGHSIASSFTRSMGKSDIHINTYMGQISNESRERLLYRLDYSNIPIAPYKDIRPGQRKRFIPDAVQPKKVDDGYNFDGDALGILGS